MGYLKFSSYISSDFRYFKSVYCALYEEDIYEVSDIFTHWVIFSI